MSEPHEHFMNRAIELAYQGRGTTAPNPCVGAVLVKDGTIVAKGYHTRFGALHAERECLANAHAKGVNPEGLTMYVTLEPCNHQGKTPPCTDGLIEAKIGTVVIGTRDPNPVAAGGIERLLDHGIKVETGICKQECKDLIADFLLWQRSHSPYNILKMASTLDGKIASSTGQPEPVSGPESFDRVHQLRRLVGAVVVGGNTFYADNPSLTCRLKDLPIEFVQPLAVVVTSRLPEDPAKYFLLHRRPEKTIFMTTEKIARSAQADKLRERGTSVWPLPGEPGNLSLAPGFERLRYDRDCHYTLCEGGGRFAMALIRQDLADEVVHFLAPRILGDNNAPSAYSGQDNVTMADTRDFRIARLERTGADVMLTLRQK